MKRLRCWLRYTFQNLHNNTELAKSPRPQFYDKEVQGQYGNKLSVTGANIWTWLSNDVRALQLFKRIITFCIADERMQSYFLLHPGSKPALSPLPSGNVALSVDFLESFDSSAAEAKVRKSLALYLCHCCDSWTVFLVIPELFLPVGVKA